MSTCAALQKHCAHARQAHMQSSEHRTCPHKPHAAHVSYTRSLVAAPSRMPLLLLCASLHLSATHKDKLAFESAHQQSTCKKAQPVLGNFIHDTSWPACLPTPSKQNLTSPCSKAFAGNMVAACPSQGQHKQHHSRSPPHMHSPMAAPLRHTLRHK
jgi:hypothetical protein